MVANFTYYLHGIGTPGSIKVIKLDHETIKSDITKKKMSSGLSKNVRLQNMGLQFIYIWYMHKQDLAWNNPWDVDMP